MEHRRVPLELALPIRDEVWNDDSLREGFIAENPEKLSLDDLNLAKSWGYRIADDFIVYKHHTKYTVFMSTDVPTLGYGVVGIMEAIRDIVGPQLPLYINTVLLPFEDRIIYDGMLMPYNVMFGRGIRADFASAYREIQEGKGIITQLPYLPKPLELSDIKASNKKVLAALQKSMSVSGLSPKLVQEHVANVIEFTTMFLEQQIPHKRLLDVEQQDVETYYQQNPKTNLVSLKRLVRFLCDTDRMDRDVADRFLRFFKGK